MRRSLVSLAIFLLLGAVCTIAVAWWLAVRDPAAVSYRQYVRWPFVQVAPNWYITRGYAIEQSAGELCVRECDPNTASLPSGTVVSKREFISVLPACSALRRGSGIVADYADEVVTDSPSRRAYTYMEYYSGWPKLALSFTRTETYVFSARQPNVEAASRHMAMVPEFLSPLVWRRELPCLPMWPGFAADTGFFGALFWTMTIGAVRFRRACRRGIRGWRGRCRECGYDLRGADHARCPECGADVAALSARQHASTLGGERKETS